MVTIKPKTVVRMKLKGESTSHARTDISTRDVETTIDEPEARGGTNMGLSPTETLMASLIGCTNVIAHKCADRHGVDIKAMSIDLEAAFDRRGVTLQEELDVPFPEVTMKIDLTTAADDAAIERMKTDLNRFCPVSKVIRQSGTQINEVWTIRRP